MKKDRRDTVAAIDVGTNFLRMMIAEINSEGIILPLEDVWQPTQIGRDTFGTGEIGSGSIQEMCDTLHGFRQLMKDYRVKQYHAVATSGVREAQNREYVLDQISVRAGLNVEIINNAQERFYEYKALRDKVPDIPRMRQEGILIVNIGMGGVEISAYHGGYLQFTEYVKVGALRLREILADLERSSLDFSSVIEAFLESKIYLLDSINKQFEIKNVIGLGEELTSILKLCRVNKLTKEDAFLHREALAKMHSRLRAMTTKQIIETYHIHRNEAELLIPSAIIFQRFLQATAAEGIHAPKVSLRHGLLADMVDERFDTARKFDFLNDIISSVRYLGRKFHIDEKHAAQVESLSLSIYDQTARIHKLGARERLYLQIAAILHDAGKYININQHDIHSGHIIRFQEIIGFSNKELNLVAIIARYHSEDKPHPWHDNYRLLDESEKLIVSKLAAILKLADSLDISHHQTIADVVISSSGRDLHFNARAKGEVLLEKWDFAAQAVFFQEVYGCLPVIKIKG
jgi:exopolyphosphatase/guanosine-5'-triphosphate,3'-diphosphate pyrophosphatase